jgi:hypothetical protein
MESTDKTALRQKKAGATIAIKNKGVMRLSSAINYTLQTKADACYTMVNLILIKYLKC